jgi:hypothetical protein
LTDCFKPVADSRGLYAPSAAAINTKAGPKSAPCLRIVA